MDGWRVTGFAIDKTVSQRSINNDDLDLPNYYDEIVTVFEDDTIDLTSESIYFQAPEKFLRQQIYSYGGELSYMVTYSGYNFEGKKGKRLNLLCLMGKTLVIYSLLH